MNEPSVLETPPDPERIRGRCPVCRGPVVRAAYEPRGDADEPAVIWICWAMLRGSGCTWWMRL